MKDFKGKKLLFLDGSPLAVPAVNRAKELGIYTIVANYYDKSVSVAKQYADEAWDINFSDIPETVKKMKEAGVDGIFQGWTDSHLPSYAALCDAAGFFCYGTAEQFDICINKDKFKKVCRENGVPVAEEYNPVFDSNGELDIGKMGAIRYPVIVKPADSSGSRGIYICKDSEELKNYFGKALDISPSKTVLIEQYITGQHVNIYYTLSDGDIYLSAMADRYVDYLDYQSAPVPVLLVHPSKYLGDFENGVDRKIREMFKTLGMKNGIAFVQGFRCDNGEFVIYEMGYRPNGGGTYSLINACSGYNQLDMLISFSLTGKMGEEEKLREQSPHFDRKALMYVVSAGTENIGVFKGLDEIRHLDSVVDVIPVRFPDEHNKGLGSHSRIAAYILFTANDTEDAEKTLSSVYRLIDIRNREGISMPVIHADTSVID